MAKDQLLLRIDDTKASATLEMLRGQFNALKALEARLIAERDRAQTLTFSPHLETQRSDPSVALILAGQQTIFLERRRALEGQIEILNQRMAQLRSQIDGHKAQVASLNIQATLIESERKGVEEIVEKGLERKPRLFALQRPGIRKGRKSPLLHLGRSREAR